MTLTLLVINIPPALEEDLVDYLLSQPGTSGFTSYSVNGHGDYRELSIAEQVSGRRQRKQFELIMAVDDVHSLVGGLASAVGRDIVDWEQPVQRLGRT